MSDTSFGESFSGAVVPGAEGPTSLGGAPLNNPDGSLFKPVAPEPVARVQPPDPGTLPPSPLGSFGSGFSAGFLPPSYNAPDPKASALDQSADFLSQRVARANEIATSPLRQVFQPEEVERARAFIPQATEQLQKIKQQKASMVAGRQQAESLGLAPGEVADEASQQDRVEAAVNGALKGDLNKFKGLQAVDPKRAEAIADQVYEVTAKHFDNAKLAFDSLSGMQNQGQYSAKLEQLRREGTLKDLEALGLKVPPSFEVFSNARPREAQALREAQMGISNVRQKLEERNTYQPMEEKEAKTYNSRFTTAYGDQITNGTWARNAASGVRGQIIAGAADPRDLGKKFVLATPEQRKAISEEASVAVPKAEIEKARAFDRTYELATKDAKGNPLGDGAINTNPNVQQGIAEGLASMLRGGSGGANVGLLNIETGKRGFMQAVFDKIVTEKAGVLNTLTEKDVRPYLTKLTQSQQRDVLDVLKAHNDSTIEDRIAPIARRAGALGLDPSAFGYGKEETAGVIGKAIEQGRQEQIARMLPNHQAVGGGDGVLQLNAQRPGVGATNAPAGAGPNTTQLPGTQPLQTPVQQATQPGSPSPGGAPPAGPQPNTGPGAPPTGPAGVAQPVTIAGQTVNVPPIPGASPQFLNKMQSVETPGQKNPWTATTGRGPDGKMLSSAGGAFQAIDSTWAANKPAGAPDKAKDATPQQQAEAAATLATKNAATLTKLKLPVNDTTLYMAHNVGAGGASALLSADPGADARSIVGEAAAKNNPTFFKGRPTVATVLQRYADRMEGTQGDVSNTGGPAPAKAKAPGLMDRVRNYLNAGAASDSSPNPSDASLSPEERAAATRAAAGAAPAALSTAGAVAGSVAGPAGTVAGGAAGGGAGQMLKDFLRGDAQNPKEIAKQAALGGVLGVFPASKIGVVARPVGAATVEGGAAATEGKSADEVVDEGLKGGAAAVGGELFGRALGMAGHKIFNLFTPDAQKVVRNAAKELHDANQVLKTETPTLPGPEGKTVPNPKYEAAQAAKDKAEITIKEVMPNAKPDEVAYAHKVTDEGVPKQEAQVSKPAALEKERVGEGYQQLEREVGAAGVGAPKATPKLPDGPLAAVEGKKVSKDYAELAQRTEMAITAPAANWQEKWTQLKDARSALLEAERDALSSTATGRSAVARDMRTLADTVRAQQEKAAKYVFGEKDGAAFMDRLKVLDTRYRNLMDATANGDLVKAAGLKGEAGRDADRKFRAFAHDDPAALAAWAAMRRARGNIEQGVHDLVAAERIPVLGKIFSAAKLAGSMKQWLRDRAAGSPATFADFVNANEGNKAFGQQLRDVTGTAAQRAAVMQ